MCLFVIANNSDTLLMAFCILERQFAPAVEPLFTCFWVSLYLNLSPAVFYFSCFSLVCLAVDTFLIMLAVYGKICYHVLFCKHYKTSFHSELGNLQEHFLKVCKRIVWLPCWFGGWLLTALPPRTGVHQPSTQRDSHPACNSCYALVLSLFV